MWLVIHTFDLLLFLKLLLSGSVGLFGLGLFEFWVLGFGWVMCGVVGFSFAVSGFSCFG